MSGRVLLSQIHLGPCVCQVSTEFCVTVFGDNRYARLVQCDRDDLYYDRSRPTYGDGAHRDPQFRIDFTDTEMTPPGGSACDSAFPSSAVPVSSYFAVC